MELDGKFFVFLAGESADGICIMDFALAFGFI